MDSEWIWLGFGFLKLFLESVWILDHALWTRSEHEFFGNTKSKLGKLTFSIGEKTGVGKKVSTIAMLGPQLAMPSGQGQNMSFFGNTKIKLS